MANKNYNGKLDELIKQTLSDIEAPYDTADWPQMESMLWAAPKSKSFTYNLKLSAIFDALKNIPKSKSVKLIFSPYLLIGLIIIAGAYLLYNVLNSSKNNTNSTPQNTEVKAVNADTINTASAPAPAPDVINEGNEIELPADTIDNLSSASEKNSEKTDDEEVVKTESAVQKETNAVEKNVKEKTDNKKDSKKKEKNINKENPPALIETPETTKENTDQSKENTQEQEEGKNQPDNFIGRNNFLLHNVNSDSIKRFKSQQPKDSLKKHD